MKVAQQIYQYCIETDIKKVDVVVIERNGFSDFQSTMNKKMDKLNPLQDIEIRTIVLKDFPDLHN